MPWYAHFLLSDIAITSCSNHFHIPPSISITYLRTSQTDASSVRQVQSMSLARLLTLPAEIRAHIFQHVLTETEKPLVTFRLDDFQRECYACSIQPALTRVSRQIRCESLPVRVNCFKCVYPPGETQMLMIRNEIRRSGMKATASSSTPRTPRHEI